METDWKDEMGIFGGVRHRNTKNLYYLKKQIEDEILLRDKNKKNGLNLMKVQSAKSFSSPTQNEIIKAHNILRSKGIKVENPNGDDYKKLNDDFKYYEELTWSGCTVYNISFLNSPTIWISNEYGTVVPQMPIEEWLKNAK